MISQNADLGDLEAKVYYYYYYYTYNNNNADLDDLDAKV